MRTFTDYCTASVFAACLVIFNSGCSSSDGTTGDSQSGSATVLTVDAELTGSQAIPAVATVASGRVSMQLNRQTGALSGKLTHTVVNATAAQVHVGDVGSTGEPIVNLNAVSVDEFAVPSDAVLTAEQVAAYERGSLYIAILSQTFPAGEIRAQLRNEPVSTPFYPTLDDIQAKVFTPICSGCHDGSGSTLPGVMNLADADSSLISLVGVGSTQENGVDRVVAGDADASYLVRKLEGTQNTGARMPLVGNPIDENAIVAIRQWIDSGALHR